LQTKLWTITGSAAKLTVGEFDRNTRLWPFTVISVDPSIPMMPVNLVVDLNEYADPKAAILALDRDVKAGALIAEIDWGIAKDMANNRYAVDVKAVRVRNLTTGAIVADAQPSQRVAYFVAGKRNKPIPSRGTLQVLSTQGVGDVYVDGVLMGKTPYTATVSEGEYQVEVRWQAEPYSKAFNQLATVLAGTGIKVAAVKGAAYRIGDTGPAGGIIFYDKGNASGGWRFLEAAPSDQSKEIQWYNAKNIDIKTGTAIGTGIANTASIIAAQGVGSYAATLCDRLVLGDYDDWFLPSKDELNLMYTNLNMAGLGGSWGVWFWSSSQDYVNFNYAWKQYFSDGEQYSYYKNYKYAVRACRAF
jgi:hypothetical protein